MTICIHFNPPVTEGSTRRLKNGVPGFSEEKSFKGVDGWTTDRRRTGGDRSSSSQLLKAIKNQRDQLFHILVILTGPTKHNNKTTITKTYLYNFDPLKPHFYIVKLGFTGVYIIFLISVKNHRLWVLVRTASSRRF